MITEHSFTKEWLFTVNKQLGWNRQDVQLKNLEKAIAALYLLECLTVCGIEFIFKGGTSLLLLLGKIYRLSVDIDIIIETPLANTDSKFAGICSGSKLFTRFERQERKIDDVFDIEHYKFFYKPFADEAAESYILLDLYQTTNPYASTIMLEISSDILNSDGQNATVNVPGVDSILGDKLTAFAPDTIGVSLSAEPGHRPKRVEVLKQLFDIGNLFDCAENVRNIRTTYHRVAEQEIEKLGIEITSETVLRDTIRHALIIAFNGKLDKERYDMIAKGFKDFKKFVSDLSFDENRAVLDASKAVYLANVLITNRSLLEKYEDWIDMGDWEIKDKTFAILNDYKYSNPEAFFYLFKYVSSLKSS